VPDFLLVGLEKVNANNRAFISRLGYKGEAWACRWQSTTMGFLFILTATTMACTGLFLLCASVQVCIKLVQNHWVAEDNEDSDTENDIRIGRMRGLYSELERDKVRLQRAKVE